LKRLLSYYSEDGHIVEYLADHINDCIALLGNLKDCRLGRLGVSLNKNFVDEVRLAMVFHDLGKAFYQNNPTIFTGHEIFSTYILHKFRKLFIKNRLHQITDYNLLEPAIFGIAFHHHPMDIRKRLEKIRRIRISPSSFETLQNELSFVKEDALTGEEKALLNSVLSELKSKIEGWSLTVDDVGREFQDEVCKRLFDHIVSSKDEDIVAKRSYYLTLVSLVCVDYISACKRRGKETRFGEVMEEFYKLYFSAVKGANGTIT
jgi:CRISPR-associated endonuclease Cas3-HD